MSDTNPSQKKRAAARQRPGPPGLYRDYFATLIEPEFRSIFALVLFVLLTGTVVYSWLEHWSMLDSLYFSVVTLATIGYGDLHPTTDPAKLFTIFYVFVGVGTLGVFISAVSRASMQRSMERRQSTSTNADPGEDEVEDDL